ncbi:MAG: NAD-dependent epimerase/dehydratase family protein [Sphingomonas sp.]|nr:NAD-dependent epimerase/dehydratase family protein [Sphingomonas sp.]
MAQQEVVLVTGASGFIGSAVIERLAGRYRLVGLDRPGPPDPPSAARTVDIDLGSDDSVREALATVRAEFGSRIASVVHLAAYYDVSGEPNPLYDEITVEGTRRLIEALRGFEVGQFVLASTMLVHRPTRRPDERIDEDWPIDPQWAYPQSKVEAEKMLRETRGGMPAVMLRIAGVYDDIGHSPFVAQQISRIYEHRLTAHLYPGMLCANQSFVHLDDLTEAVARLIERRGELPEELPLLVGEPEALGYEEVQNIIGCALHGEEWTTIRVPQALAEAGTWLQEEVLGQDNFIKPWMVEAANDHYILDIGRARSLLDWQPEHRLGDTLPGMVEALKRDPVGWYRENKLNPALVAWHGPSPRGKEGDGSREAGPGEASGMPDGGHGHEAMMAQDARRTRWAHFANIGLGLWLASSPLVFGLADPASVPEAVRAVTAERGLAPIEWRSLMLAWNDVATGLLIALFGALSLSNRTAWFGQWANCFAGLWLLFVPLLLWAPSPAVYSNEMLVGALVIAFSVLVPMMPGMDMKGMMDPVSVPPGWTYSPSTAAQRFPIVVMGVIGLLVSRHLTAYQLGHVDAAWEPFFAGSPTDPRNGTEEIITSYVSRAWPIPDAGLGAVSYLIEILMAVMGTRTRWRTMPWMVTFFGILVVPLGVVSIYFIIIQPILLATWSTPALIAGLAMLIMIPFALDELVAMGQFLVWSRRRGRPLVRTFFKGGAVEAGEEYEGDAMDAARPAWAEARRGVTLPKTLAASIAIGLFLMLTRILLGTTGAMANSDHLVGALVITVAIIATAEVARPLRFANAALGLWLMTAPWLLEGGSGLASVLGAGLGFALVMLSLPRGPRSSEHYAGWDRFVV